MHNVKERKKINYVNRGEKNHFVGITRNKLEKIEHEKNYCIFP